MIVQQNADRIVDDFIREGASDRGNRDPEQDQEEGQVVGVPYFKSDHTVRFIYFDERDIQFKGQSGRM